MHTYIYIYIHTYICACIWYVNRKYLPYLHACICLAEVYPKPHFFRCWCAVDAATAASGEDAISGPPQFLGGLLRAFRSEFFLMRVAYFFLGPPEAMGMAFAKALQGLLDGAAGSFFEASLRVDTRVRRNWVNRVPSSSLEASRVLFGRVRTSLSLIVRETTVIWLALILAVVLELKRLLQKAWGFASLLVIKLVVKPQMRSHNFGKTISYFFGEDKVIRRGRKGSFA